MFKVHSKIKRSVSFSGGSGFGSGDRYFRGNGIDVVANIVVFLLMNKKKRFFLKYIIKKSVEGIRGATVSSLDSHFVILTLCIFLTWRIAYFRPGGSVAGKNAGILAFLNLTN